MTRQFVGNVPMWRRMTKLAQSGAARRPRKANRAIETGGNRHKLPSFQRIGEIVRIWKYGMAVNTVHTWTQGEGVYAVGSKLQAFPCLMKWQFKPCQNFWNFSCTRFQAFSYSVRPSNWSCSICSLSSACAIQLLSQHVLTHFDITCPGAWQLQWP